MNVFLVNREFAVSLSTTKFYLSAGDLAWVKKDSSGCCYIYKVGYYTKDTYHELMVPLNLNYKITIDSSYIPHTRLRYIKQAVNEGYMTDITIQYNRDAKINELWKSLEVEI